MTGLTRRRTITLLAAAAPSLLLANAPASATYRWSGTALGADAEMLIAGLPHREAEQAAEAARLEVQRLEAIFSLYQPQSELARLNANGVLERPSQDLRILLHRSLQGWHQTGGAFNPAVQPLWQYLARLFATDARAVPDPRALKAILARCDPGGIEMAEDRIKLAPGMALTLNGIAQGYITDMAAELLERRGLHDILINMGEFRALDGRSWSVAISDSTVNATLCRRAMAQSAGRATPFSPDGKWHHIIDPATGHSANRTRNIAVSAATAADADLLSTALYVAKPEDEETILAHFPGAKVVLRELA